ncbi:MAG: MAPEG family protein [Gammaproteobacteria bacterium]
MRTELLMLGLSVILGLVQILLPTWTPVSLRGLRWALGPRDESFPQPSGLTGRLDRALHNFLETFPLFAGALLAVLVSGRTDQVSILGAELYFWARLIYVPAYAAGIPGLRTLVWLVSVLGIVLVLIALL